MATVIAFCVLSVIVAGEHNYLLSPAHPDFRVIRRGGRQAVPV